MKVPGGRSSVGLSTGERMYGYLFFLENQLLQSFLVDQQVRDLQMSQVVPESLFLLLLHGVLLGLQNHFDQGLQQLR